MRPWAIGAAAFVVAGIVAALVTGGGSSGGGQMTVVNHAPPPKKGDKVLAAGETNVHGVRYRVVVSKPGADGPKRAAVPLYINEYMGSPPKLLQRFEVPNARFYRDSVIASFKIEAKPDPNPDKAAGIAFSWFHHVGDQGNDTKYYSATTHGIQLY